MPARGKEGYENAWKTFHLASSKTFKNADRTPIILGGLSIQSDTTHVTVAVSPGAPSTGDAGVYKYEVGLTSVEGMVTKTPYIPMPGIAFEQGVMKVDIGASPGVTVLYKGDHS